MGVLFVLAVGAGWLLLGRRGASVESDATTGEDESKASAPAALDLSPGRGDALAGARSKDVDSWRLGRPAAAPSGCVHGRVVVFGGAPIAEGVVHLSGRGVLRRVPIETDGSFRACVELAEAADPRESTQVTLTSVVRGWASVRKIERIRAGSDVEVDFTTGEGLRVRGRVVDPDGHAVPGLKFLLLKSPRRASDEFDSIDDPTDEAFDVRRTPDFAWTTTDETGKFEFHGLDNDAAWPISLDPLWLFDARDDAEDGLRPSSDGAVRDVGARPAFLVEGFVIDAQTGMVPMFPFQRDFGLRVGDQRLAGHGRFPANSQFRSRFRWSGPMRQEMANGFQVDVILRAAGYRTARAVVEFGSGERRKSVELAFTRQRPEDLGRLIIRTGIVDANGREVLPDVNFHELQSSVGMPVGKRSDGGYSVELSAGPNSLSIHPDCPFGAFLQWTGTIDVIGGRDTPFQVPFGAHGAVRLGVHFLPTAHSTRTRVELSKANLMISAEGPVENGALFVPALPVGTWTATQVDAAVPTPRTFTVEQDREVFVDLGR